MIALKLLKLFIPLLIGVSFVIPLSVGAEEVPRGVSNITIDASKHDYNNPAISTGLYQGSVQGYYQKSQDAFYIYGATNHKVEKDGETFIIEVPTSDTFVQSVLTVHLIIEGDKVEDKTLIGVEKPSIENEVGNSEEQTEEKSDNNTNKNNSIKEKDSADSTSVEETKTTKESERKVTNALADKKVNVESDSNKKSEDNKISSNEKHKNTSNGWIIIMSVVFLLLITGLGVIIWRKQVKKSEK